MAVDKEIIMKRLILLLPAVLLVVCVSVVQADTIHVPADYELIQVAIYFSEDGDTVLVADGIYRGEYNRDIDFIGKAIVVMSENGPLNCVIDCEGIGRGFVIYNGEDSNSVIQGFTITNGNASIGGGIYCDYHSSSTIIVNTIFGNEVNPPWGGGIFCSQSSSPTITGNTISGNSATWGGGIYCSSSSPTIENNTITLNNAYQGGGIYCNNSSPTITNTILWNDSPEEIYVAGSGTPVVTYSNIQGSWQGEGNIYEDPMFLQPDTLLYTDYRLLWGSPCIDIGDPTLFDPDGTRSDMGAYYFNQNDYLTLYLTPDVTEMLPGDELGVTYTAINRWDSSEAFWLLSQVLLSGGSWLNILGPDQYTLPANYTAQVHFTHPVPNITPIGMYEYRSLIGVPPGTLYDGDSFKFQVY